MAGPARRPRRAGVLARAPRGHGPWPGPGEGPPAVLGDAAGRHGAADGAADGDGVAARRRARHADERFRVRAGAGLGRGLARGVGRRLRGRGLRRVGDRGDRHGHELRDDPRVRAAALSRWRRHRRRSASTGWRHPRRGDVRRQHLTHFGHDDRDVRHAGRRHRRNRAGTAEIRPARGSRGGRGVLRAGRPVRGSGCARGGRWSPSRLAHGAGARPHRRDAAGAPASRGSTHGRHRGRDRHRPPPGPAGAGRSATCRAGQLHGQEPDHRRPRAGCGCDGLHPAARGTGCRAGGQRDALATRGCRA